MTVNVPTNPESGEAEGQHQALARKNRGVRFSDPEWEEVRETAQTLGVTPAEFVRERILELVRTPATPASVPVPADLAPLIERTFRYTHMLATRMRDDMIDDGHRERLDALVSEARELQASLLATPSSSTPEDGV